MVLWVAAKRVSVLGGIVTRCKADVGDWTWCGPGASTRKGRAGMARLDAAATTECTRAPHMQASEKARPGLMCVWAHGCVHGNDVLNALQLSGYRMCPWLRGRRNRSAAQEWLWERRCSAPESRMHSWEAVQGVALVRAGCSPDAESRAWFGPCPPALSGQHCQPAPGAQGPRESRAWPG